MPKGAEMMFEQLKEMEITCERLGRYLGVSGRTIRGWKKRGSPLWAEMVVHQIYTSWKLWKEVRDA